ncbi:MAG: class I SAM-dependent methyltransferase [Nanoarchaeota archaeon]
MKSKQVKNIDLWKKVLNDLPASYKSWFEDEKKFLHKYITKNALVLEVGCGDGRSVKDLLDITQNITAIDHDQKAVDDASNNFKEYPSIKIIWADAMNIPLKNKMFDFVLCLTTFANFGDNKYKILEEMKRVLKKDGTIIISVFSEDAFKERMKVYKRLSSIKKIIDHRTVIFDGKSENIVSEQFSKEELKEIFQKVNLKIDDIQKSGIGYICGLSK